MRVPNRDCCFTGHTNGKSKLLALQNVARVALRKCYKPVRWKAGAAAGRHNSVTAYSPNSFSRKRTHRFSLRTDNDEVRAKCPDLKLNGYSSPHVRTLCGWDVYSARNTLRGRLSDDVKQYFTHFARPRPNGIALFVPQSVDQPICVEGKNHWFSVHCCSQSPSFTRLRKADPVFYSGLSGVRRWCAIEIRQRQSAALQRGVCLDRLPGFKTLPCRTSNTQ